MHHAGQPDDIGRVKPDGRLIQHVQDAGRAVADGTGELHPLSLASGEGGGSPVQRQIPQPQIEQPFCHGLKRFADAFRHGTHLFRERRGDASDPFRQIQERHPARLIERDAPKLRRSCCLGETGASAVRADLFLQKLFHTLHALFILDFCQGVFHGIDCIVIGKIELACLVGFFGFIEDVLLLRRTIVHDVFFLLGQIPEGHVGAHAHFPADIGHQRPHQGVPGGDSPFVDCQRLVGHKGGAVHSADGACAVAGAAGSLAVEGKLLRRRCVEVDAALRTDQLLLRGDRQGGLVVVSVWAPVACKPGIHQAEAVEKLSACAEGAADARDSRPLVEGEGSRHVQNIIHVGFGSLGHTPPGIRGKGIQISPGSFGVEDAQGEGRFAGSGHAGDADDLPQRNVCVYVFQIVDPRAADQHFIDHEGHLPLWLL